MSSLSCMFIFLEPCRFSMKDCSEHSDSYVGLWVCDRSRVSRVTCVCVVCDHGLLTVAWWSVRLKLMFGIDVGSAFELFIAFDLVTCVWFRHIGHTFFCCRFFVKKVEYFWWRIDAWPWKVVWFFSFCMEGCVIWWRICWMQGCLIFAGFAWKVL